MAKRRATPTWMANPVPRFEGPNFPKAGDFLEAGRVAPLDLWPTQTLQLATRHALTADFRAAAAAELARRT